jgi:hypothetical protein
MSAQPSAESATARARVTQAWRTVELFVPCDLDNAEVTQYIHAQLRRIAHEGGEFIDQIAIGTRMVHSLTWQRYSVSYLPGPPGTMPT